MNRNRTNYEWIIETLDFTEGDEPEITDVIHFDTHHEAVMHARTLAESWRIGLVRDVGNDVEGLTDRSWAYVNRHNQLPERFEYSDGQQDGPAVPKRFHKEIAAL